MLMNICALIVLRNYYMIEMLYYLNENIINVDTPMYYVVIIVVT